MDFFIMPVKASKSCGPQLFLTLFKEAPGLHLTFSTYLLQVFLRVACHPVTAFRANCTAACDLSVLVTPSPCCYADRQQEKLVKGKKAGGGGAKLNDLFPCLHSQKGFKK